MQKQYAIPVTQFSSAKEQQLYYNALAGDPHSKEVLGKRYLAVAGHVCRRALGDVVEAEDAAQDAMLNVFNKLHQFNGKSIFKSWVYSIALHKALDYKRKREIRAYRHPQLMRSAAGDLDEIPYDDSELVQKVLEAGEMLFNDKQRIIFFEVDVGGRKLKDIAEENGWNPVTARSAHSRAKGNVEMILKKHFGITRDDFYSY